MSPIETKRIEFRHPGEANGRLYIFNGSIRLTAMDKDTTLSIRGPGGGTKVVAILPKDKALEVARAILELHRDGQTALDKYVADQALMDEAQGGGQ